MTDDLWGKGGSSSHYRSFRQIFQRVKYVLSFGSATEILLPIIGVGIFGVEWRRIAEMSDPVAKQVSLLALNPLMWKIW
jgi:hypothetical protein